MKELKLENRNLERKAKTAVKLEAKIKEQQELLRQQSNQI
jgi:hypothetical protein